MSWTSTKDDGLCAQGKVHRWTFWMHFLGTESLEGALIYSQQFQQVTLGRRGLLFQLALLLKFRGIAHLSLFQASGKWRTASAFSIPLTAYR